MFCEFLKYILHNYNIIFLIHPFLIENLHESLSPFTTMALFVTKIEIRIDTNFLFLFGQWRHLLEVPTPIFRSKLKGSFRSFFITSSWFMDESRRVRDFTFPNQNFNSRSHSQSLSVLPIIELSHETLFECFVREFLIRICAFIPYRACNFPLQFAVSTYFSLEFSQICIRFRAAKVLTCPNSCSDYT